MTCPSGHKLSQIKEHPVFSEEDISCRLCSTEMINNEPFYWSCNACCYSVCHFCAFESHSHMTATATKRKATKKLQDIKAGFSPSNTTIVYEKSQDQANTKFNLA